MPCLKIHLSKKKSGKGGNKIKVPVIYYQTSKKLLNKNILL